MGLTLIKATTALARVGAGGGFGGGLAARPREELGASVFLE